MNKPMRLECVCGNVMEFVVDKNHEATPEDIEENGHYATKDPKKFDLYAAHEELFIGCLQCKRKIYMFT